MSLRLMCFYEPSASCFNRNRQTGSAAQLIPNVMQHLDASTQEKQGYPSLNNDIYLYQ